MPRNIPRDICPASPDPRQVLPSGHRAHHSAYSVRITQSYSLAPSLPHCLTASLPHSLTPSLASRSLRGLKQFRRGGHEIRTTIPDRGANPTCFRVQLHSRIKLRLRFPGVRTIRTTLPDRSTIRKISAEGLGMQYGISFQFVPCTLDGENIRTDTLADHLQRHILSAASARVGISRRNCSGFNFSL